MAMPLLATFVGALFVTVGEAVSNSSPETKNESTCVSSVSKLLILQLLTNIIDASQVDASQVDASQADASQVDASQVDASQGDASQVDASQVDASQVDVRFHH